MRKQLNTTPNGAIIPPAPGPGPCVTAAADTARLRKLKHAYDVQPGDVKMLLPFFWQEQARIHIQHGTRACKRTQLCAELLGKCCVQSQKHSTVSLLPEAAQALGGDVHWTIELPGIRLI